MREVTKAEFHAVFFERGRGADGWTQAYWDRFYENDRMPAMKYRVELPQNPEQTRMMIVDDFDLREHRLFFMSEEAEQRFFQSGGSRRRVGQRLFVAHAVRPMTRGQVRPGHPSLRPRWMPDNDGLAHPRRFRAEP